jgi:predicted amidophosphoribosyltransferase
LEIPVETEILFKIKQTRPQLELKREEREKNLVDAFQVNNKKPASVLRTSAWQRKIFLVDDVYTTGSTMQNCALALKSSGAKQVWGITICRGK